MTIFSNKMAHNQQILSQIISTLKTLDVELKNKHLDYSLPYGEQRISELNPKADLMFHSLTMICSSALKWKTCIRAWGYNGE